MSRYIRSLFFMISGIITLSIACSKQNETELQKTIVPIVCTTDSMSYSKDIVPILQNYCYSCHGNGNTGGSGGINLDGYANLKPVADNGHLVGQVTHAPGFIGMPFDQPKMPDCEVSKIVAWVDQGAQNN